MRLVCDHCEAESDKAILGTSHYCGDNDATDPQITGIWRLPKKEGQHADPKANPEDLRKMLESIRVRSPEVLNEKGAVRLPEVRAVTDGEGQSEHQGDGGQKPR